MKMSDGLGVTLVNSQPVSVVPSAVATMTTMNNISASALNCNSLSPTSMANLATVVNNHVNATNMNNVTTNGANHHHLNNINMNINMNNSQQNTQNMADYLAQLIKDKKQLAIFPNLFMHLDRVLDEEIARVRGNLFHLSGTKVEPLELPEPVGPVVTSSEKVYVPVKEHPDFNFVGRILGPRGMTAKQLEQETGCKIMVRGKGSMRDKKKEEVNRGKPNWEHLNDELHVLITVEDTENRAKVKLQRAVDEVKKLLIPAEGEDELKKRQLMELAIINGTYRDSKESRDSRNQAAVSAAAAQLVSPQQVPLSALRAASTPLGAPLIISPHRLSNGLNAAAAAAAASGHPQLMAQHGDSLLYAASPYTTADYATYLQLAEYPPEHVGKMSGVRRLTGLRDQMHPYLPKTDPSASLLH
ncbi:protein held out wings isoform X3 [Folsomia candida]|uniref:protein held out wings isoform X3 n=1 Tax=Folsomia candida TaxID=158441 RepID=UPI000B904727|nr:protein held out wings isoform X3 [Folsomia candida]